MTSLHDYGGLLLASRLRKVAETMYAGVDDVYRSRGVTLPSRCFPILFLLRDNGPLGITELAERLGQSHPAVSQMSKKLLAHGVVRERTDRKDDRRRMLALSASGRALMKRMAPVWDAITEAVDRLNEAAGGGFVEAVTTLDAALEARPFADRIATRLRRREAADVEIIPFAPRYAADFKRLNVEWLEKYFTVEPVDEEVLSNPLTAILEPGGRIFLARHKTAIVGTCALIVSPRAGTRPGVARPATAGAGPRYELSKMAVTARYQGCHIGQRLLQAAIDEFTRLGGSELYLESNSALRPALTLYEANGFVHTPRPGGPSHYARGNVYMVYRPRTA